MTLNRLTTPIVLFAVGLFLSNCSNQVTKAPEHVHTLTGSNGEFGEPFGITIRNGQVFVSDGDRGKIFRVSPDGIVTELASGLHTPSGIAFTPNGDLIVADSGSNSIKLVDRNGTVETIAGVEGQRGFADGDAAQALFNGPVGVAVSDDGTVFITDTYSDRIRVLKNRTVSTWVGGSRGFRDGIGEDAQFDTPLGITIWQKDKLLVADVGNRRIRVVEPDASVWTLAGNGDDDLRDGTPLSSSFVRPTAVAVDANGRILVADGNAIRAIGGRIFPFVETISNARRGFRDGPIRISRFNRPSGIAVAANGDVLVSDSDNRVIRSLSPKAEVETTGTPTPISAEEFRALQPGRWPFDPPDAKRDIAGTLGEIRGEIVEANSYAAFHNGLDIAGQYGETARFVRNEKVLDPLAAENFGTLRELLRMPTIGYIHLRLGRDKDNKLFDNPRFQFKTSEDGTINDIRVARGTQFNAGEPIGTLNAMNHVHLIAGRSGSEMNALASLSLPNISDTIAPPIEQVELFTNDWSPFETENGNSRIKLTGNIRIVARVFDRMDGNPERRKLGVYKLGYQVLKSDGSLVQDAVSNIRFDRMPPNEAVKFVYSNGSHSEATGETIFNYIVTNRLDGDRYREGLLDTEGLEPGIFTIRVYAADIFGNTSTKDIPIEVIR